MVKYSLEDVKTRSGVIKPVWVMMNEPQSTPSELFPDSCMNPSNSCQKKSFNRTHSKVHLILKVYLMGAAYLDVVFFETGVWWFKIEVCELDVHPPTWNCGEHDDALLVVVVVVWEVRSWEVARSHNTDRREAGYSSESNAWLFKVEQ